MYFYELMGEMILYLKLMLDIHEDSIKDLVSILIFCK